MKPSRTSSPSFPVTGFSLSGPRLLICLGTLLAIGGYQLFGWHPYSEVRPGQNKFHVERTLGQPIGKTSAMRPSCKKLPGCSPVLEQWTYATRDGAKLKLCVLLFDTNEVVFKDVQQIHAGDRDVTIEGHTFLADR